LSPRRDPVQSAETAFTSEITRCNSPGFPRFVPKCAQYVPAAHPCSVALPRLRVREAPGRLGKPVGQGPRHSKGVQIADLPATFPSPRKRRQDSTPRAYPPSMQEKITAIAGVAIVLAGCGGSSQTAVTLTSTLHITKTVTVTAPPPTSVPKTTMETDGTYRVGTDIVPGIYRSAGASPEGASDCYWARLSSLNETHIIDSNISTGPQVVTIQPSDRAFLTHSCLPWQKAD